MDTVYVVMEYVSDRSGETRIICVCATQETALTIKNSERASMRWISKETYKV